MSTGPRIAILAALPREVRGLLPHMAPDPGLRERGIHLHQTPDGLVATAGMGAARVALAFEVALAQAPDAAFFSVGLAGACIGSLPAGSVVEAATVVDARTGERFRTDAENAQGTLVTTETIAGVQEKSRLANTYAASMVDMEAATVARLARAHGLSFRAIKGISDAHDFELASLARFAGAHGQFRTAAFAWHTAVRPHQWRHATTLGRHSTTALAALHVRLREILQTPR